MCCSACSARSQPLLWSSTFTSGEIESVPSPDFEAASKKIYDFTPPAAPVMAPPSPPAPAAHARHAPAPAPLWPHHEKRDLPHTR